ncbi:MAG: DUF4011 domain-containing protein [Nannocystaceae bacterium]
MSVRESPAPPQVDRQYFDQALEKIRSKLLDSTRRNRLLNFKKSGRDVTVVDEMPDQVHQHLVLDGKSFCFDSLDPDEFGDSHEDAERELFDHEQSGELPQSQVGSAGVAARHRDGRLQTPFREQELERRLRRLYREHRMAIEETGANNLYLAMGFLHWSDDKDENKEREREKKKEPTNWQHSPLMLVPVRLERQGGAGHGVYHLVFDDRGGSVRNFVYGRTS